MAVMILGQAGLISGTQVSFPCEQALSNKIPFLEKFPDLST